MNKADEYRVTAELLSDCGYSEAMIEQAMNHTIEDGGDEMDELVVAHHEAHSEPPCDYCGCHVLECRCPV